MVDSAIKMRVVIAVGLLGPGLYAQSLWLPASDPVGIARVGAGVSFGRSLEAAALNPALLVTLDGKTELYASLGMEMASSQETMSSTNRVLFSTDRNRSLLGAGLAYRWHDKLAIGLKLDQPFARHGRMPQESASRFFGHALDLETRRLELQAAWAFSPQFSVGIGLGVARIKYAWESSLREMLPVDPTLPVNPATNPAQGLVETSLRQEGSKIVPSYSLGFRYAMAPRWTLAGAFQSSLSGTLPLTAQRLPGQALYGLFTSENPPLLPASSLDALLARSTPVPGTGECTLPARATLGVRQRLSQFFTWEVDLRYIAGSSFRAPGPLGAITPSGLVRSPELARTSRSSFGISAMGECSLDKAWTLRFGFALDPSLYEEARMDALWSGAASSSFAIGAGYRVWGGEFNLGYQVRINRDSRFAATDGAWDVNGWHASGGNMRVESMGHLWALGYKVAF